jgi:hypothetical protein
MSHADDPTNTSSTTSNGTPAEVPLGCPVETSGLTGTHVTDDEGNNGVIFVNARNGNDRPVIMYLLATTPERGQPDYVRCLPPILVGPHGVKEVHMNYDPAGGPIYGYTYFRLWHSRFAREDELK